MIGDLARTDDYDPFERAAARTARPYRAAQERAGTSNLTKIPGAIADMVAPIVTGPGASMAKNPYPEGSEEASFFEDQRARNMGTWSRDMALNTMGTGAVVGAPVRAGEKILGSGPVRPLFDYSRIHEVPGVQQFDLVRYDPPRGVSERVQNLVADKKVEQKMLDLIEKGKGINAETFYYNEPLREAFVAELGKKEGPKSFARYMDYVAASSPRSDVETNARNASYYYMLERQGKPVPPQGGVNPQPYGHMAQNLHRENAEKIRSGEYFNTVNNPKPLSFSQNLQGNFAPVTVDAHAFKLPAMLKRDPDFLAGSVKLEKGQPTINPTKMFESGELSMKDAVNRPVFWDARPNRNEYGAMEQYYKRLAREAELTPAQTQAAAWAGGGKITGLESVAGDPFMRSVENRAIKTAAERGISPQEALSQMMRGKAPLLGLGGGAIVAPAVMGGLAAQDQYQ